MQRDLTLTLPDMLTRDELRLELTGFMAALLDELAERTAQEPVRVLSKAEAAQMLGVAESTLHGWIAHRSLPAYRIDGRVLILSDELRAWVQSQPSAGRTANGEAAAA